MSTEYLSCESSLTQGTQGYSQYSLNDCGLSPEQYEDQDGFLCEPRAAQQQQKIRSSPNSLSVSLNTDCCLSCSVAFKNNARGMKRYSLRYCGLTAEQFEGRKGFLCFACMRKYRKKTESAKDPVVRVRDGNLNTKCCLMCESPFIKVKRNYSRRSLKICGFSPDQFDGQDGFLCLPCVNKLQKLTRHTELLINSRKSSKRKRTKRSSASPAENSCGQTSYKDKVYSLLESSHYSAAFTALLRRNSAKQHFHKVVKKSVQKEVRSCPQEMQFSCPASFEGLNSLKWDNVVEEAATHMPLLVDVLKAALPDPSKQLKKTFCGQKVTSLKQAELLRDQRLGFILSLVLYARKPVIYNFIQSCLSLQLAKSKCASWLVQCLHSLGVCKTFHGTMHTVRMAKKSSLAKQVRDQDTPSQQIESSATLEHTEICEMEVPFLLHMDTVDEAQSSVEHVMDDVQFPDGTMWDSETFIPLPAFCAKEPGSSQHNDYACTANETQSTHPEPGYTLVCNHIPADSTCRPQSCEGNANMCTFAIKNRIMLDTRKSRDGAIRQAQEVPLSCFLPSSDDWQNMKHRMCLILECILRDHFLYLQNMKCSAYVRHKYSLTTRRISEIVRLGEQENMSTSTPGAVHALESLHQFVPSQGDDLHPVVCFGDKHSVKQMVHAKHSRSTEASAAARLEGLVLCPQDLQRRGVLLKDTIDRFFKKESASDPGTLCHLKKHFGYGPVKKITKNFNHVQDFLDFCTRAYSVMLALQLTKLDDVTETPRSFPSAGKMSEKKKWLKTLTQEMVDFIWPEVPSEDINRVCQQENKYEIHDNRDLTEESVDSRREYRCICGENTGKPMIRCGNSDCGWFHYSCADADIDRSQQGDWWCSAKCQASESYIYCKCHKKTGKEKDMVQCELQSHCLLYEWYHSECIEGAEDLPERWFCSAACKEQHTDLLEIDGVQEYSKALLFEGLCHQAYLGAIREGNGPAILSHWRINTIQFWNNHHFKYFNWAHNMLAGVSGVYPAHVAHDITWNRVANLTDQPNDNISLDQLIHSPQSDYEKKLFGLNGWHSKEQVQQCNEFIRTLSRNADNTFLDFCAEAQGQPSMQHPPNFDQDVKYFADKYQDIGLFDFVPGRHHKSFPYFKHFLDVKSPERMGKELLRLSLCMDRQRNHVQA